MFEDLTPFVLAISITFMSLICIAIWNSITGASDREPKSSYKPDPGPSRTREILSRFSEFFINLEPEEGYIYDTGILPDPKQHIVHALYVGYDESETEEDKEAIERGLRAIVHFQDLVGADPLRPEIKNNELTIDENENQIEDDKMEEESISIEEKKYREFLNKSLKELDDHIKHLKIQKPTEASKEKEIT